MAKLHLVVTIIVLSVATVMPTPATTSTTSSTPPQPPPSSPLLPPTAASLPATALPPTGSSPPAPPTAYEMLEQYNLSRGILPEGVTGYDLCPDGSFEMYLPGDCNIHIGETPIRYSSLIAGNIQSQWLRDLKGVKVRVLLTWIAISEVNRTDDQLNFFAGRISKSFPIDKFASSPQCNVM